MKLAFALSQNELKSDASTPFHCVQYALSKTESKEMYVR